MIYVLTMICMIIGYCVSLVAGKIWLVLLLVVIGNVIAAYANGYNAYMVRSNREAIFLLEKADEALREASEKLQDDRELIEKVNELLSQLEGETDGET